MKVGIVHGAAVYDDGSLYPHTRERANSAIAAYREGRIDTIIAGGIGTDLAIASYVGKNINSDSSKTLTSIAGLGRKSNIIRNPYAISSLRELYDSKLILNLLSEVREPVEKVLSFSQRWHAPRLERDGKKILSKYDFECIPCPDPRSKEEVEFDASQEKTKSRFDLWLLRFGYGRTRNPGRSWLEKAKFIDEINFGTGWGPLHAYSYNRKRNEIMKLKEYEKVEPKMGVLIAMEDYVRNYGIPYWQRNLMFWERKFHQWFGPARQASSYKWEN